MTPEKLVAAANNVPVTGKPVTARSMFGIPTAPWDYPSLSARQAALKNFTAIFQGHRYADDIHAGVQASIGAACGLGVFGKANQSAVSTSANMSWYGELRGAENREACSL